MPSLFTHTGRYTEEATRIYCNVERAMRPFFEEPHSTREVLSIAISAAASAQRRAQIMRNLGPQRAQPEAAPVEEPVEDVQAE